MPKGFLRPSCHYYEKCTDQKENVAKMLTNWNQQRITVFIKISALPLLPDPYH